MNYTFFHMPVYVLLKHFLIKFEIEETLAINLVSLIILIIGCILFEKILMRKLLTAMRLKFI